MTIERAFKLFVLSIMIIGCTTVSNVMKDKRFNDSANDFHYAMRWSDFKTAVTFRKETGPGDISSSFDRLKKIKITSFSIIETIPSENEHEILQVAEIQYYKMNDMKEKTVVAHMMWEYDDQRENWYIVKGWPDFQ